MSLITRTKFLLPTTAHLGVAFVLLAALSSPARLLAQHNFTSVAQWKKQYALHEETKSAMRLMSEFFLPFASEERGLREPFRSAGDKDAEEFYQLYVATGAEALKSSSLKTATAVRKYATPSAWAGREYVRQYTALWWQSVQSDRLRDLLEVVEEVYTLHLRAETDDHEKVRRLDALLLDYNKLDCARYAPRDGTFFQGWRGLAEEYRALHKDLEPPERAPFTDPGLFIEKEAECRKTAGLPG